MNKTRVFEGAGPEAIVTEFNFVVKPVLGPEATKPHPRDNVIKYLDTTYGRIKLYLSVHSYFAPWVELNGVKSPGIKWMIDDQFSNSSISQCWRELSGTFDEFRVLVKQIHEVILDVHHDPNAESDVDAEAQAA